MSWTSSATTSTSITRPARCSCFAPTHRGMDGKPIPSRFAERAELEALLDVLHELDAGIVGVTPGDQCSSTQQDGMRVNTDARPGQLLRNRIAR
jgi:hypothetical protein